VALKRADVSRSYLLGLHSIFDRVVRHLGSQRCRADGVPGDVCERSVCVELLTFLFTSTCMPTFAVLGCDSSSSLFDSQPLCTACVMVRSLHCMPRCTRSTRRVGDPSEGVSGVRSRQKSEVRLRVLISQVARIFFGGLVSLGGPMSLHLVSTGGLSLSEESAAFRYGGSLAVSLGTSMKQL